MLTKKGSWSCKILAALHGVLGSDAYIATFMSLAKDQHGPLISSN